MTRRHIEERPPSYSSAFLRGPGARPNFLLQEAPRWSAEATAPGVRDWAPALHRPSPSSAPVALQPPRTWDSEDLSPHLPAMGTGAGK